MLSRIVYSLLFLNVVWRVSASEDDEKVKNIFKDNITRTDFAKLLQSLIKLNEQRVNVLQKLYKLEDYGVLSEVLRSGGAKHNNKDLTNMILVVLSKNESQLTRKRDANYMVDAIPSLQINTANKSHFPPKYAPRRVGSDIEPIFPPPHKKLNSSDHKMKHFHGSPYMHKKLQQKQKKLRFPSSDFLETRASPATARFQASTARFKFPKVRDESNLEDNNNVYHRLKDDFDQNPIENKIEPIRGQPDPNMDMYADDDDGDGYEDKMTPPRNKHPRNPFNMKINPEFPPEIQATEFSVPRYPNPAKKRKGRFEIDHGKRKERFQIDDGKHLYTENPTDFTVDRLYNNVDPIPKMPIRTSTKKRPGESNLIARDNFKRQTESNTEQSGIEKVRVTQMDADPEPTMVEPEKPYTSDVTTTVEPVKPQKGNLKTNFEPVKPQKKDLKTNSEPEKPQMATQTEKGKDYDIVSLEMGDGSPTNIKSAKDVIIENEDGVHYVQSDFEPESMESRKNLGKCIGKKASKLCIKSCNEAYKNVCRRLRCTKKAKRTLKKECKNSCKNIFKTGSKSKDKDKDSDSSSDSSD